MLLSTNFALLNFIQFLPRDAMQSEILLWQVVCLSARNVEVL